MTNSCGEPPAKPIHHTDRQDDTKLSQDLLNDLTPAQQEAVTTIEGPLLVVAAAGSGKTRVITRRVAHMLNQGISGNSILALTFTNKAA